MTDFEISEANGAHAPQIALLEQMLFSDAWSEQSIAATLASPFSLGLVAECEGRICGYLLASLLPPEGELYRIGVHPDFRRRGIALALMEDFLSAAEKRGSTELFLEVRADNAGAIALYRRTGFADDGIRKGYYKDPVADALLMRRKGEKTV